ncbi:MAG: 30S ribosomal protein S17 [Phycisphaerales bacterium]
MTTSANESTKLRGTQTGVVVGAKSEKTRKVTIEYLAKHPKYGKYIRRRTTLQTHDEQNLSGEGDRVEIAPCRPMSKTKRWRIVRVLEKAPEPVAVTTTG